jgi:3-oxoacyl-[acyl-carrier protein] reductase
MNEMQHRCGVVTGAAQGIGLAIATAIVREGGNVVIADLNAEAAEQAAAAVQAQGPGRAVACRCDVVSEDDVAATADAATTEFGGISFWVNNAGILRDKALRKMTLDDFRTVLDVHVVGAWLGLRAAASAMREDGGSIVNMSSISGKSGNPGQTNYSAAKAALVGLTKAAAKELARHQIRVNCVQPGLIRTAMTAGMPPDAFAAGAARVPLRRVGEPEDIAEVVTFLLSDRAAYMTGAVVEVTGGVHM